MNGSQSDYRSWQPPRSCVVSSEYCTVQVIVITVDNIMVRRIVRYISVTTHSKASQSNKGKAN